MYATWMTAAGPIISMCSLLIYNQDISRNAAGFAVCLFCVED